jgi:DNA-binding MarR family transcriptional regulator
MVESQFNLLHQNSNIESKIVVSLERISQAFKVLLWSESKENSLSPIQTQILIFLLFHSPEKGKVSYLANEFNLTKATISDTIKTLESKELIRKVFEEKDARSYTIELTESGKKTAELSASFAKVIQNPIDELPEIEKEKLLENLLKIIYDLNQKGIITIQRMCFNCQYYQIKEDNHYCNLLNKTIVSKELRVDCPEHNLIEE